MKKRIEQIVRQEQAAQGRCLLLTATPVESANLRTIFSSDEANIRSRLERPPAFRSDGWDLRTGDIARILKGEFVRVSNGQQKVIHLYRDGCLIFAARDYIGLRFPHGNSAMINPLALIEVVVNFTRFYDVVLSDLSTLPKSIEISIGLRNAHLSGVKSSLIPKRLTPFPHLDSNVKEAPDNNWSQRQTVSVEGYNPDHVAFNLIREFYLWFGYTDDTIPYFKAEGDRRVFDID